MCDKEIHIICAFTDRYVYYLQTDGTDCLTGFVSAQRAVMFLFLLLLFKVLYVNLLDRNKEERIEYTSHVFILM